VETIHRLIAGWTQGLFLHWLFGSWFPDLGVLEFGLDLAVLLVEVGRLLLADDGGLVEVAAPVALEAEAAEDPPLCQPVIYFIRRWFRILFLLFNSLDFAGHGDPRRFLIEHVGFEGEILANFVGGGWRQALLDPEDVVEVVPWLDVLVDSVHYGLVDVMVPQLQIVTWDALALLAHLLRAHLDCFRYRHSVFKTADPPRH
jgi:hypothetical protein